MRTPTYRHRQNRKRKGPRIDVLTRIQSHVAGIDCGAFEHVVAVLPIEMRRQYEPSTFTHDLFRLANWTPERVASRAWRWNRLASIGFRFTRSWRRAASSPTGECTALEERPGPAE